MLRKNCAFFYPIDLRGIQKKLSVWEYDRARYARRESPNNFSAPSP